MGSHESLSAVYIITLGLRQHAKLTLYFMDTSNKSYHTNHSVCLLNFLSVVVDDRFGDFGGDISGDFGGHNTLQDATHAA